MIKEEVLEYLNEYSGFRPRMIPRELAVSTNSGFIISLLGPRRAGKTYYLFQLAQNLRRPLYLNFEDSRLRGTKYSELRELIRVYIEMNRESPGALLLDEIQNVEGWEIIVRELHDLKKYKMFITGSSSKLLSREIATQLRGRTLSYLLLPFSFREFLKAKNFTVDISRITKDEAARLRGSLNEYMEFGGFPEVVLGEDKTKILKEYSDLALFKDFVERNRIKNISLARYLHESIIQNFSKEISTRSVFEKAKGSGIQASNNTTYDYLEKIQDTVMFFFLERYSKKAHVRSSWPKKVYLADTGLAKVVSFSKDEGKLMENAVFLELLRRKNSNPLLEFYYLKSVRGEVDFVVKDGANLKQLIQVTYAAAFDQITKREVKALLGASADTRCRNLLVLTWNYEGSRLIEGKRILFQPLWRWLLSGHEHEKATNRWRKNKLSDL